MRKIKILVTATGCPGASTLIRALRDNGERAVEIIGTDMDDNSIGRFYSDRFYKVPAAHEDPEGFIASLSDIVKRESPDVLFPESSYEVYPIALNKYLFEKLGAKVVVSDPRQIEIALNKYMMYETLKSNGKIGLPEYYYPKDLDEFVMYAYKLGYPSKPVCFKPHVAKGSRGFRILDESISRRDLLLNYKPESRYMSLKEFTDIFKAEKEFPKLVIMEKLGGPEFDAMTLCYEGEALIVTVKSREQSRWGTITVGELVRNDNIEKAVREIIPMIPLSYNISLQFIGEKLIEINPRTSTYIYQKDLNEPYLAVKLCMDEATKEDIRCYGSKIRYGRRMLRYMDQIFWDKESEEYEVL